METPPPTACSPGNQGCSLSPSSPSVLATSASMWPPPSVSQTRRGSPPLLPPLWPWPPRCSWSCPAGLSFRPSFLIHYAQSCTQAASPFALSPAEPPHRSPTEPRTPPWPSDLHDRYPALLSTVISISISRRPPAPSGPRAFVPCCFCLESSLHRCSDGRLLLILQTSA